MNYQTSKSVKVAVLKGGISAEREISLESGAAVADALRQAGHQVTEVDLVTRQLPAMSDDVEVVFPVLHGEFGEDGQIQKLLEEQGISYVGCDSKASALIMDKAKVKEILDGKIRSPLGFTFSEATTEMPQELPFPFIVKPNSQGSTIGLTLVRDANQWQQALEDALSVDSIALVEEFVRGTELTVGVVDGKALPVVEIIPPGDLFDFDAKYAHTLGDTEYNCPPKKLSPEIQSEAQRQAVICYALMGCRDVTRMDFIASGDELYFLEGNSLPGFTSSSLLPKSAAQSGICFEELCDRLVQMAVGRAK